MIFKRGLIQGGLKVNKKQIRNALNLFIHHQAAMTIRAPRKKCIEEISSTRADQGRIKEQER